MEASEERRAPGRAQVASRGGAVEHGRGGFRGLPGKPLTNTWPGRDSQGADHAGLQRSPSGPQREEKTDSEALNGGMSTRVMTSGHFPEKLRRAGAPEFPDGPNTLCPHLFPVRVPGPPLLVRTQFYHSRVSLQPPLALIFSLEALSWTFT